MAGWTGEDAWEDAMKGKVLALFTLGPLCLALVSKASGQVGFARTDYPAGAQPAAVVIADFNGDGKADLAVANFGSNNVSILLGNGSGTFGAASGFATGNNPVYVAVGDFNADNKLDLAVANQNSDSISV